MILDLYSSDRHGAVWDDPERFRPDRFLGREIGAFELIPQGGGDHHADHRCAGEWVTIRIMERALRLLLEADYRVPEQDLSIDLARIPAIPKSRVVIRLAPAG